ncbi:ABC-F family ATP-binding cassette domain-containing protein [Gemmatimonadota bacterium]
MTLIAFSNVAVQFGGDPIFTDVGFNVDAGERWGIVGRNGTGKTTLLRLMTGAVEPSHGSVTRRAGLRMTLLDQHRDFGEAKTVWEAAAQGYRSLLELERSLARESERLGELGSRVTKADLGRFDRAQERFTHEGGYSYHARVEAVLQGLGFDANEATERPLTELSGGERGRVGLAAGLAAPADLVLLDEPTNHLDLDTIEWLKTHLRESGQTVMVISHDRAFLDDVANHILHFSHGTVTPYRGGYSSFVTQRNQALLTLEKRASEQQKEIARQEEFIRRNIAGQKTAQAKSRRTRLARLPRLSPPAAEDDPMALRFVLSTRGGNQVMVVEDLVVSVGPRRLVNGFSAVVRRGDVIAVVGPNGAGKSTLLATLLGEQGPEAGTVRPGAGVTAAWYRQDHTHLPDGRSLFDCVGDARPTWNRGQIQDHLGRFGFSGDEVKRKTGSLSGGERARVALAIITLKGSNLLALDEPTNHLDVESIEALEDALEGYPGTVLLVSHDRALLRELSTRVWAFREGRLDDYPGSFVDWERKTSEEDKQRATAELDAERQAREMERVRARRAAEAQRDRQAPLRAARREVEAAERRVHETEKIILDLEAALTHPDLYDGSPESAREAGRLNALLREARNSLDEAMTDWAAAAERVESLES